MLIWFLLKDRMLPIELHRKGFLNNHFTSVLQFRTWRAKVLMRESLHRKNMPRDLKLTSTVTNFNVTTRISFAESKDTKINSIERGQWYRLDYGS